MKTTYLFSDICRIPGRRLSIWLAAIAVTACLQASPAHAQRRPPTIPPPGVLPVSKIPPAPPLPQVNRGQPWSPTNPNGTWIPISQLPPAPPLPMTFAPAISAPWPPPGVLPVSKIPPAPPLPQVNRGQPWSPTNPHGTWIPISQLPPAPPLPMTFTPALPPVGR